MADVTPEAELSRSLVRRRAKSGAFYVGSSGVVNLLVGFFGNLVLARLLLPRDFGIVAIGATLMMVTTALADGGLGGGLIRREQAPERSELRAALALQLTVATAFATVAAAIGVAAGGAGLVVALMMIALPVAAVQMPGRVVLSRALRFRELSVVESLGMIMNYACAIAGVLAGFGVWALASGVVVRALVTSVGLIAVSGLGIVGPTFRGARALGPVISFGLRFQAVSLAGLVREQGLNAGVGVIAGVSTLGFWTLAKRLLELPVLVFEPLHRVSLPFMSHVLAAREDPGRLIERGVAISATASGLVLAAMAAASPELVPSLFGAQWRPAGEILPWVCAALLVAGPVAVVGVGYLYAAGAPSVVLRATIVHTAVLFAVALPLLPALGPKAIGIGALSGAVVDCFIMARAIKSRSGARPFRALRPILALAALAAAAGLVAASMVGSGLLAALAGGSVAAVVYFALLGSFQTDRLRQTLRLTIEAVQSALTREPPVAASDAR